MDGGDEQAFLKSLDISAYLNQEVRDVEEDAVLFQNQFLTCTVILTGDGKGMQAMGGAGSKCWLCKDPNGIVEQIGVESTSRWGAFLRSVTPDRRPGDYQHAACRILNGIAKRTEITLQALPPAWYPWYHGTHGTPRNGGTFFSFPPSQRSIGMGLTRGGSKIVLWVGPW